MISLSAITAKPSDVTLPWLIRRTAPPPASPNGVNKPLTTEKQLTVFCHQSMRES